MRSDGVGYQRQSPSSHLRPLAKRVKKKDKEEEGGSLCPRHSSQPLPYATHTAFPQGADPPPSRQANQPRPSPPTASEPVRVGMSDNTDPWHLLCHVGGGKPREGGARAQVTPPVKESSLAPTHHGGGAGA